MPLKAFEAAIHRPIYKKSATVPTQTDTSTNKSVETQMPKCDTDVDFAGCNVHPFYFAQCRSNPVLTEQHVGKRPTKRELVSERAKQARQAATDLAAGQTPAYVPTEVIDLDMSFAEPPLYHTPQHFMTIASATSMGSLSVDSSQYNEDNILEMSRLEDMDHGSPQVQREMGNEQQRADANIMQPQSDVTVEPMTTMAITEQRVGASSQPLPAEVTHESLNQINDVVIERATRNLPAEEAQTNLS